MERRNAAADTMLTGNASAKRTVNACIRCRSRKSRCDGKAPSCGTCAESNTACEYARRRRRGPGKRNGTTQALRARLERVENLLQRPPTCGTWNKDQDVNILDEDDSTGNTTRLATDESETTAQYTIGGIHAERATVSPTAEEVDASHICGSALGRSVLEPSALLKFPDTRTISSIKASQDQGCFPRITFAPLPPKTYVISLMTIALEEMSRVWAVFDAEWIFSALEEQYAAGLDNCHDNPARWASINAIFACAVQWKAAPRTIEEVFPISWSYFKNAFAVFPELFIQGRDLEACRAVLLMAIFMHGTADAQTTSSLLTAAVHLAQALGLHQEEFYLGMKPVEAEHHKKVFWAISILSRNSGFDHGLVARLCDNGIQTDFPYSLPSTLSASLTSPISILRHRADLSIIQSGIHRRLYLGLTIRQKPTEHLKVITETDHQLECWRLGVTAEFRPIVAATGTNPEPGIDTVLLHFAYYAATWKIRMAMRQVKSHDDHAPVSANRAADVWAQNDTLYSPAASTAARAIISLIRHMPLQPLSCLWDILVYPLCAVFVLVEAVLDHQFCPETPVNVASIGEFVTYLRRLQLQECYDLRKLLSGCFELYQVAYYVTNHPFDMVDLEDVRSREDNPDTLEERCKALYRGLRSTNDLMRLSQGLMSNIPTPCGEVEKLFSSILGIPLASIDSYGPFVPDILKPQTYNFSYGARM